MPIVNPHKSKGDLAMKDKILDLKIAAKRK